MSLTSRLSPLGFAWLVVGLLMPVALLNYLDRQMLASIKSSVMADIPSIGSDENWGFMLGQFKWVYAFMSPIGGYIADRFSRRLTICASLFVWSAVTFWTGHVDSYQELLTARSLMGLSEAFYIPAALALIADLHTGQTRSKAVGMHQMAIYCGVIVGGFTGYIADAEWLGWRAAFDICGVFGMLYAIPLALVLRDAPRPAELALVGVLKVRRYPATASRSKRGRSQLVAPKVVDERPSPWSAAVALLLNLNFILLVLYFTLPALAGWVVRDWMPAILKKEFDLGQGIAGVAATLPWQAAAIVGSLLGGTIADSWMRVNHRGRIYLSAIGMTLMVPAIAGVGFAPTLTLVVILLLLFGLGWGFFDCNNMPILSQIVRPDLRATGYGIMNLVSISCGGLADWGFGALRDRDVPLGAIFGVFAATAAISAVLVLLIRPAPPTSPRD
ncbi:major facilitator superfamily MFS_1 [Pirellula staleyi DSM 6068]|uniref:Major facilitator superfamily MFS_1 n=1 Tax=Pirellula staleyi (strain ATCC 27377 / DSM 6068 / ICPB 4128) TaxID=530564 RepID=D2QW40_PIRSD|nr:MFS transporter [Pirellula staleyi]ADB15915.1 major facilitator superfamily MFS_1 [Pirellula staleyi DSM 6068]